MKITDVKTFVVDCYRTNWIFVKVYTDEGITGVGEATLEYKEHAVIGAIDHLRSYLIGKNPMNIELHYHNMYRDAYWRGGAVLMSALSAIETCLWDIASKYLGVPVYQLLGGRFRDSIKIYVNGWFSGAKTPQEFAERAQSIVQKGVKAIKWDPFGCAYMNISHEQLDAALECVSAVKEAIPKSVDILIEGHGRFNVPTAIMIAKELEQFSPLWFEEPVPPDNINALAEVKSKSPVAIAAGERFYTRYAYREVFEKSAADFIQPDVSHSGGIMECRKIAAMAEAYYLPFAPHNPSGPVASAATLQLAACTPNFYIMEIMAFDVEYRNTISNENLLYKDGCIEIPETPGLGIEIDEDSIRQYPYKPHDLRHYNGNLTDIQPVQTKEYF
jgi:galactonate dehydratase